MASPTTIPRFLLPRANALLTYANQPTILRTYQRALRPHARHASTKPSSKAGSPKTLEKPDKFRPPSHPARLVKTKPSYQFGPRITEAEKQTHATKQYPHSPPPLGSAMHKFLNNRGLHMTITLSVLFFFAIWTFVLNFRATSPFADQWPSMAEFMQHPLHSLGRAWNTIKLHELHESEVTAEKRRRAIEETMKTKAYRVMHGLEPLRGQPMEVQLLVAKMRGDDSEELVMQESARIQQQKRPLKKWLGIW